MDETRAPVNWVWRAVVLACLTLLVPALAYPGLFEALTGPYCGMPKHLAEFLAAAAALFLSMLTLKVYNDKDELGLDIGRLFAVRPVGRMWRVFLAGAAADLALMGIFIALMLKYYPDYEGSTFITKMWSGNDKWFFVFTSTVMYAACEEIFLRGLVFTYIRKRAGLLKALLVSSLLFSLLHVGRLWVGLVLVFFDGVIYALAYEKTRSLAVPCLLHGLHNFALRVSLMLGLFCQ